MASVLLLGFNLNSTGCPTKHPGHGAFDENQSHTVNDTLRRMLDSALPRFLKPGAINKKAFSCLLPARRFFAAMRGAACLGAQKQLGIGNQTFATVSEARNRDQVPSEHAMLWLNSEKCALACIPFGHCDFCRLPWGECAKSQVKMY